MELDLIQEKEKKYLRCFTAGMKKENKKVPELDWLFVKKSWTCMVDSLHRNVHLSVPHLNAIFLSRNNYRFKIFLRFCARVKMVFGFFIQPVAPSCMALACICSLI